MKWKQTIILLVTIAFLVTGCGSSNAQDEPSSQEQAPQETSQATPTETVAQQEPKSEVELNREAADLENGKEVFLAKANCTQCHQGGRNTVIADKHLGKDALEKYNMDSMEAIAQQVKNGKSAMPAYGRRLSEEQIRDVAAYVLSQAENGWKN